MDLINFFISYKYFNKLTNDSAPSFIKKKIQLQAEQLMWALTSLEINEACHINSSHLTIMVDCVTSGWLKRTLLKDS